MIFSVERTGFIDCKLLVNQIMVDLEANGFIRKFPTAPLSTTDTLGVFEASPSVDPLAPLSPLVTAGATAQPWRIRLEALDESKVTIVAATPLQLPADGSLTSNDDGFEYSGHLGVKKAVSLSPLTTTLFINRSNLAVDQRASSPMSYRLSIAPHGISLFVWEPGNDSLGNNQSWFVIQRTVNNTTGVVKVTGKSPIHCLYGIKHTSIGTGNTLSPTVNLVNRFVVREADISRPTQSVVGSADSSDSARIININTMVSITEDNNYVISFPNGLNTQRFAYPTDELDLMGYTSSDVISQNSDVSITVYGETVPRIYKAMSSSGADNTGMRVLVLASGGSI